jgi:molybdopterin synthase sulfur carrier subunit
MTVKVRLFASLREAVGRSEVELQLAEGATPETAWEKLSALTPSLQGRRPGLSAAVNRRYVAFDTALRDGDELVFIPPVSGG